MKAALEPTPQDYKQLLKHTCALCERAYLSDSVAILKFVEHGWIASPVSKLGFKAWLLLRPQLACIVVQGSNDPIDWIFNGAVHTRSFGEDHPNVRVHRGFAVGARCLYKPLTNRLNKIDGIERLVVTGHSLGGAIATLLGHQYSEQYPSVSVVTFGSPSVGNRAFNQLIAESSVYTINCLSKQDPVPRLPSESLGYKRLALGYEIGDNYIGAESGLLRWWLRFFPLTIAQVAAGIQAHLIESYSSLLHD